MTLIKFLLIPIQLIYYLIVRFRNLLFDLNVISEYKASTLVISIGNLKVGGTGKTPHVEYLIKVLKNYKIAVLSRGYKRKTKGFLLANNKINSALQIGDENCQLYNKFNDILIACDSDRVQGVKKLLKIDPKIETIILDDGYQHRSLKRDMNILLTEFNDLFTNDSLLPRGKLREPIFEKKRANIIIVTKCPHDISKQKQKSIKEKIHLDFNQKIYFSYISKYHFLNMQNSKIGNLNKKLNHLLVTGIENPRTLLSFLEKEKISYNHIKFNDHHNFSQSDINKIIQLGKSKKYAKELLFTEKDFYRLLKTDKQKLEKHFTLICIQIEIDFIDIDKSNFNHQLCNFVESKII